MLYAGSGSTSQFDKHARAFYDPSMPNPKTQNPLICSVLKQHFGQTPLHELVTATREFPATARLDLQTALTEVLSGPLHCEKLLGAHAPYNFETTTFSHLLYHLQFEIALF